MPPTGYQPISVTVDSKKLVGVNRFCVGIRNDGFRAHCHINLIELYIN